MQFITNPAAMRHNSAPTAPFPTMPRVLPRNSSPSKADHVPLHLAVHLTEPTRGRHQEREGMFRNAPVAITGNIPHGDTEIFAVLRTDIARN